MGTQLVPNPNAAYYALNVYFKQYVYIDTVKFKSILEKEYPDYEWSYLWCSKFLHINCKNKIKIENVLYYSGLSDIYQEEFIQLFRNNQPISKKNLKKEWLEINNGVKKETFEQLFEKYATWNHQYNSENHKLYIFNDGDIDDIDGDKQLEALTKEQLEAIIEEHLNDLVTDPTSYIHQVLKAYFTYDIKRLL